MQHRVRPIRIELQLVEGELAADRHQCVRVEEECLTVAGRNAGEPPAPKLGHERVVSGTEWSRGGVRIVGTRLRVRVAQVEQLLRLTRVVAPVRHPHLPADERHQLRLERRRVREVVLEHRHKDEQLIAAARPPPRARVPLGAYPLDNQSPLSVVHSHHLAWQPPDRIAPATGRLGRQSRGTSCFPSEAARERQHPPVE